MISIFRAARSVSKLHRTPSVLARSLSTQLPVASAHSSSGSSGSTSWQGQRLPFAALAAAATTTAAAVSTCDGAPPPPPQMQERKNVVLGDAALPEALRPHRVALCEWPADQCKHNGDARTASLHALFSWVRDSGYDGVEMTVGYFGKYLPNMSQDEVARVAKEEAAKYGLRIFGANVWWVYDFEGQDWSKLLAELREEVRLTAAMGGEYVSFQMWLPAKHQGTAGAYRRDEEYLDRAARRIEDLHKICWEQGMNCYIETHVQRLSEDPEAFVKIMERTANDVEINGDLSHYVFRAMRNDGQDMAKILARMGHTHQRMCRQFGDLSVNVQDPAGDWAGRGVTFGAFDFSRPGFDGGLSSRVICGESGPMHQVSDPLSLDAKLVPLYRAMAADADASVRGQKRPTTAELPNPFAVASA